MYLRVGVGGRTKFIFPGSLQGFSSKLTAGMGWSGIRVGANIVGIGTAGIEEGAEKGAVLGSLLSQLTGTLCFLTPAVIHTNEEKQNSAP